MYVRELTEQERSHLTASLRSASAFTLRRAQVVLASARKCKPSEIATQLGCAVQSVRNAIHAFDQHGLASLVQQSSRPKSARPLLDHNAAERVKAILHQSPRAFDHDRSLWSLELLAMVLYQQGLSQRVLSIEAVRQALLRFGWGWRRAKHWITSPDPAYAAKKKDATS